MADATDTPSVQDAVARDMMPEQVGNAPDAVPKDMMPEQVHFTGRVLLCTQTLTPEAVDWLARSAGPLGFDSEWKPDRRKQDNNPIALIQLADLETTLLLRTCGGTDGLAYPLPDPVRHILEDVNVVKVCSGFDGGDAKKFRVSFPGMEVRNVLPITQIAKKKGLRRTGLQGIAEAVGAPMAKKKEIARSNWEAHELSAEQIQYAADDAWFSLMALAPLKEMPDRVLCPAALWDVQTYCEVKFPPRIDLHTDAAFGAHFVQSHLHAPDEFNSACAFERHLALTAQKAKLCIHCTANGIYAWSHTSENCEHKTRRACGWCLKARYVCVHEEDDECPWKQQADERIALKEQRRAERIAEKEAAAPEKTEESAAQ
eukprot:GEMP01047775.1.p1 GENE.GEMP01047775.1~~GEMP01047775.1.p1  ORF type:complete len:372 (+),score=113.75 GEMP01047775.1:132-1247(+)